MKLSLEKVNKFLLLLALASLFFRNISFSISHILNPFEMIFILVSFTTLVDLVKNDKIKEFFGSIPKNIWIALGCLVFSIVFGSLIAVFSKGIPINLNMIKEFGTFVISLMLFLCILFYTRNEEIYSKKYLYALLIPIVFILFIIFPELAYFFHITQTASSGFQGLTTNVNIFSKMMLIPTFFFTVYSLFEEENKWLKTVYILIASGSVALLFWSAERGGLLAFGLSVSIVWFVYSLHERQLRKILFSGATIFLILLLGFALVPSAMEKVTLNRILNFEVHQSSYDDLKDKSIAQIFLNSFGVNFTTRQSDVNTKYAPDSRLEIWPVYLKYILKNPVGIGPNTHVDTRIEYTNRTFINPGPHSTYIEILLWGGVVGLVSLLYIIFFAFKNIWIKLKNNFTARTLSLFAILIALSVAIMFNDSIQSYWFWAILALSLRI